MKGFTTTLTDKSLATGAIPSRIMLAGMTFSPRDEVPIVSKFFDKESPGAGLFNELNSSKLANNLHEVG